MTLFLLLAAPVLAQMTSLLTMQNVDFANTAEFPANTGKHGGFFLADSREAGLAKALHIVPGMAPHASWQTDETDASVRYLRLAFTAPLAVGTLVGGGGEVSYLKPGAAYPGDVADNTQWVPVPVPAGQAGLRVLPFPAGVTTRAIRFTFHEPPAPGTKTRSGFGGLLVLAARLHNLTPEAEAYASSAPTGAANLVESTRVQNLITGGTWSAAPKEDISPAHPEWVILTWPQAKTFTGIGFLNAFAKTLVVEALNTDVAGHPAAAPNSAWSAAGTLAWPVWWRPAYTDAYVKFAKPVTTRALRVRLTEPLTKENPDIERISRGTRRVASLGGVMAFTDLGALPVPPRPKVAVEPPPIQIPLTMPAAGKLTLAIDDAKGVRVRNLVAEVDRPAGAIVERWDGRDDAGKMVAPGTYTVKAITHGPLHLAYQATVNCSGTPPWWKSASWGDQAGPGSWLSDHAPPNDVTAIKDRVFIGAVIAESGHTILACDLNGNKVWGTKWLETAGAGFLTNDGVKVYSAGEGGWIGNRLMVHEIDPATFKWRRVTQLTFDTGNGAGGGLTGIAAGGGKVYLAFNAPARSWLRSAIATGNLDEKATSPANPLYGGSVLGLWRTSGDVPPHGAWQTAAAADPVQHLALAFTAPQPVGTLVLARGVEAYALKPGAEGDVTKDEQWIALPAAQPGALAVVTAPPMLVTRKLRFTQRNAGGKPWSARVEGGLLLARRFVNIAGGAQLAASVGTVKDGAWTAVATEPITSARPADLTLTWPEARVFRGLGFVNCFAKRVEIAARASADGPWTVLGELTPAVRWRPAYSDDYFDCGKNVTEVEVRLRVLEPWTNENTDIEVITDGKPTRAALGGLIVLQHAGNDPLNAEVPTQRISVVDIATGAWETHYPVAAPRFPQFDERGNLLVVSGKDVVRLSLADGAATPLVTGLDDPRGLAFDAENNLYVADRDVVKVFTRDGKLLRTIGTPGGRAVGPYDPLRLANPQGIAVDMKGQLWVAESDHQPKRTSVWTTAGRYVRELIGPAQYGGGGFIDPRDKSRFYYNGVEYRLDWATGAWGVRHILCRDLPAFAGGKADHPVYLNGRQYMVNDPGSFGGTSGGLLLVGMMKVNCVLPCAAAGNAEMWTPLTADPTLQPLVADKTLNRHSFTWADANGDGLPQPAEVTVSEPGVRLNPGYWPNRVNDKLELTMGNRLLRPEGFTVCGAPIYRPFAAKPLPGFPAENIYATAVDGLGRVLVNGRPVLAMRADGSVPWRYPQAWVGIHDSHGAPSPQPGQLIGGLGFIGQETIPGVGETVMLSGNKGEWYLFTADGLLAATLWRDYRTPGVLSWNFPTAKRELSLDNVTLGEEHFGGEFVRTGDGKYYLVAGHNHNSIVEVRGLETLKRQGRTLTVTAADVTTAEAWGVRQALRAAAKEVPKTLTIAPPHGTVKPDGLLDDWAGETFTPLGTRGSFAAMADGTNLFVAFRVDGNAALTNSGDDWKMLFKTGDSVDVQLGLNTAAPAGRTAPAPGDVRLLISTYGGKPIAVLYRHRVPGTPAADRVAFASPWRTEFVDKVERLDVPLSITRSPRGYTVEAIIPWASLGGAPRKGVGYQADFGILTADSAGLATLVRTYWANKATGIVSDVPSEITLTPALWGEVRFE
jgi:hypothetical protein